METILNWRIEERKYVDQEISEYLSRKRSMFEILLTSEKQKKKNIKYIEEKAINEYRIKKLDRYYFETLKEISEERKRIDKLVKDANIKLNNYLKSTKCSIDNNIKPFILEIREYNNLSNISFTETEIVKIHLEPFDLKFMQNKLK